MTRFFYLNTFITLFAAGINLLSAQNGIPQPTHSVYHIADNSGDSLLPASETFYYFSNGLVTEQKHISIYNGIETLSGRTYNTYNTNGRLIESLYKKYDQATNQYTIKEKSIYVYDAQGHRTFYATLQYDAPTNSWDTTVTTATNYTPTGKISDNDFKYFPFGAQGFYGDKYTNTYDAQDRLATSHWQNAVLSVYKNSNFETYFYQNNEDKPYYLESQKWNSATNNWDMATTRINFTYSPLTTHSVSEFLNSSGNWLPSTRTTNIRNTNDQAVSYLRENWNVAAADWRPFLGYEYTYNADKSVNDYKVF
ncbi:MAG: hypothetical protein IT269_10190 [Saprospiraceae bacterium]|nr:hypothetical protein [Saprospiraceae bacterium]